jgi:Kef-type K+ transport system membrane component KefB
LEALTDLALMWAGVFVAVVAARWTRLTPVLWFLFVGAVLVNVGWLPVQSEPFIRTFAEVGIIVIMFALGFEENTANFIQSIRRSWGIALFGAVAPFLCAYLLADYFWHDTNIALMCGLTMTATAVSLTMVSLRSEGLQASPVATRIMTSAVLDDIAALAVIAVVVPMVTGEGAAGPSEIALVVGKALAFFVIVTIVGAWVFPHETHGWFTRVPLLGRYGMRHILGFAAGEYATLTVLLLALAVGLLAHVFGFHPAVGAYMAGLVLKEEYFHKETGLIDSYQDTKRIVDSVAFTWIGPVFFVELGSKLVLDWEVFVSVIPETFMLLVGMFVAQVSSAGLAARYTGGMSPAGSLMIGFGMLGRAELAMVVMNIAYVEHAILNTEAFYTLMFTAFWLNVAVPVTIRIWKPYYERYG